MVLKDIIALSVSLHLLNHCAETGVASRALTGLLNRHERMFSVWHCAVCRGDSVELFWSHLRSWSVWS